ncbi:anti-phage dCTP deaminase [Bordetella genomosp. 8]|uniref:anti-phage dCTP deaminase n=1 Tax=Bordetella genomosp. 8 TaxID=1416806 RepID=UPI0012FE5248|nr:anti-phage dCTP deaminase [Bordetella genomosp. 8]
MLQPQPHPELVIGLVGPVGVNLEPIITALRDGLAVARYKSYVVRLSKLIENLAELDFSGSPEHERIGNLMTLGTHLREQSKLGDAAAILAIAEIARIRDVENHAPLPASSAGNAFILRSLKHPAEVERLRTIYGKGFLLISVYSPRDVRVTALAERLSRSGANAKRLARSRAEALIARDESEDDKDLGQDVQDAFPLADLFVDARNTERLRAAIQRFLHLTFGNRFRTPTKDEHGMFHARAAALRSADLNRQVGAAIMQDGSDVITVGCNDVPKSGGDQYWEGDPDDDRDFRREIDSSAEQRTQMFEELFERLSSHGYLNTNKLSNSDVHHTVASLIDGDKKRVLKGIGLMNLLEFGRSVHAEMAALMSAARLGRSVKGATLYCTTFPCHMCARHIVASGIKRVVYVEPYPKSRARQLHADAIAVDPIAPSSKHVNFEPFEGIAPRQYQSIFSADDMRKQNDGRIRPWRMADGKVRFQRYLNTYLELEVALLADVVPLLQQAIKPLPTLEGDHHDSATIPKRANRTRPGSGA